MQEGVAWEKEGLCPFRAQPHPAGKSHHNPCSSECGGRMLAAPSGQRPPAQAGEETEAQRGKVPWPSHTAHQRYGLGLELKKLVPKNHRDLKGPEGTFPLHPSG